MSSSPSMTATEWRGRWRIATDADRTSDEYAVWLLALLQHCRPEGRRDRPLRHRHRGPGRALQPAPPCRDWFHVEPLIARAAVDWGFEIRVERPHEVGADRLLNSLAAHHHYRGPLVVIDFGTATTFDVVDADGAYLGGVIAPGHQPVDRGAAPAPPPGCRGIGIGRPQAVIGRDTVAAMQSGIYWGYVGLIEGIVGRIQAEYEAPSEGRRHRRPGAAFRRRHDRSSRRSTPISRWRGFACWRIATRSPH